MKDKSEKIDVKCTNYLEISKLHKEADHTGMTLLATDAADNVVLAFFDLRGTKHNKENHANSLALYAINLDNMKVVGPTYFNERFDKMDMQHHKGRITTFGITVKHRKSDPEFNVKTLVYEI